MAWPLLFSHKKRHYLTIYFNQDPAKAAAERDQLAKDPKASAIPAVLVKKIVKFRLEENERNKRGKQRPAT